MPQQSAPPGVSQGGARTLRATIIACLTGDDGACIMCADCGHIFAESKPLSDESQPIDNVTLSKALYYHMCAIGRRVEPSDRAKAARDRWLAANPNFKRRMTNPLIGD